ncbi:MAG: hypothetical protein A2268_14590 [Candidatus Raymondbacteria bacterium RifOxyA12_full_50_37]|uniref:Lipoprotein n=1 Tax=Candidatus Raymondbacteria bacterium RIFOXYD12_FULL_49_13 TaxID=1817890 RepID=A0A1F7F2D2_UNCRA|nr:MAG: hypothetical protein A2268_14590 [Candidatus Raymondbacteria bacterium RifOxyA12_full_50_37]OGJ88647.1 MAG: hypothetical protein A2248_20525 [Candidatus Raymondbacteria bacterium RIFOXYA2_FULL_49_16]OGJ90501.1 MAG: hypothetical protein A2350_18625 [Candidatus Raymondbacteria bacterium RifOxyB12_full_50_8]OGK00819.1 MAG: hypothetical protein A2519_07780 [Candidatus Raymondbacteria bacterium RIFOXYD12_FULL_49_13]OGK02878.1 MAG: hypothetical protein A2487_17785 [Candidatus Raymondbacteria 
MKFNLAIALTLAMTVMLGTLLPSCNKTTDPEGPDEQDPVATVRVKNDFNNPAMAMKPPWTICKCNYRGVEFGKVLQGDSSAAREVSPGIDYVLMVLAWNDTACSTQNCLPVASKIEEEVVDGQTRTIAINAPNHQGPCPPEGVQPIPDSLYDRILDLYPEYQFLPYDQRTNNPECLD